MSLANNGRMLSTIFTFLSRQTDSWLTAYPWVQQQEDVIVLRVVPDKAEFLRVKLKFAGTLKIASLRWNPAKGLSAKDVQLASTLDKVTGIRKHLFER